MMQNTVENPVIFEIQKITDTKISDLSLKFEDKVNELKEKFMPLKINGINDKDGYNAVHEARQVVKKQRISLEKDQKEFKALFRNAAKQVDDQAEKFFAMLKPIESHLFEQEKAIDDEKERIKKEKERAIQEKLDKRIAALSDVKHPIHVASLQIISDEEFQIILEQATADFNAEMERLEKLQKEEEARLEAQRKKEQEEAEIRRAELEKLKKEREEQEAERKRLDDERKALQAEKEAFEAAERGRMAAENARKREEEAKELARKRADEETKIQEQRRIAAEKAAQEESERLEALKPDKEKINDFIAKLECLEKPDLKHTDAIQLIEGFNVMLDRAIQFLKDGLNEV